MVTKVPGGWADVTLRDHENRRIHAYCPQCGHHDRVEIASLADIGGWDAELSVMVDRLRCSGCGHRPPETRLSWVGYGYYYPQQ